MKQRHKASPFDALLGLRPARAPLSGQVTVVVEGKAVHDSSRIAEVLAGSRAANQTLSVEDHLDLQAEVETRRKAVIKAKRKAADARYRAKGGAEKQRAWALANPDRMRGYRQAYRERHADRIASDAAEGFKKRYYADPEAARKKNREYYAKNRDRIKQRQLERKAERAAQGREQS